MNDRILVPLDGSPRAEQILVQVARLLRREDAQVLLVRVVPAPGAFAGVPVQEQQDAERASAQAYLAETARTLEAQGVRAVPLLREGPPAEAILQAASDEGATMIAISTHGRSGAARWLFGSVAEKVLRAAPVPVLLMRSFRKGPRGVPLPSGPGEIPFRRILVPVDGSAHSLQAIGPAAVFASLFGAKVDVLCVEDPPLPRLGVKLPKASRARPRPGPGATAAARTAADRFREFGVPAQPKAVLGEPAEEILATAEATGAGLIAMATHGRSGMSRWALGSVTERVLRHSTLPLLITRARPA
jgi:nucleotide-binding universal stress UspA family protein